MSINDLPTAVLHIILSKVCTYSVRDFGNARIAIREFNLLGRDDHFYRSANLVFLNDWVVPHAHQALRKFRRLCYDAGNPEATYLIGVYEYFDQHQLDAGREKIMEAAVRGCELAKFVAGMMDLVYNVDPNGIVRRYPNFSREFVYRMSEMITRWEISWRGDYETPAAFLEMKDDIQLSLFQSCRCSRTVPPFVRSWRGVTRWMCDKCFWQYEAWEFCDIIPLTAHEFRM